MNELVLQIDEDRMPVAERILLVDLGNEPIPHQWQRRNDGEITFGWSGASVVALRVLWEIEGHGLLWQIADAGGDGYAGGRLDLARELAWSALARLRARVGETGTDAAVRRDLEDAQRTWDAGGVRNALDRVLCLSASALERLVLAQAKAGVGALSARERTSMRFGCNAFVQGTSERYHARFVELFDFATIPIYRIPIELDEGVLDWRMADEAVNLLAASGVAMKGHPLVWAHPLFTPAWMQRLSWNDLREVVQRQIAETVGRYRGRITGWDCINEAHTLPSANAFGLDLERQVALTELATRAVTEADPNAERIVAVSSALWGEYVLTPSTHELVTPLQYLRAVVDAGIEFDVVGIHMYGPPHDMTEIAAMFDRFAAFGKPVHITEMCVPSQPLPARRPGMHPIEQEWGLPRPLPNPWWHGPWSPEIQSDWLAAVCQLAIAHPAVESVTWWDLADSSAFLGGGGLLDADDEPKPSYDRLRELLTAVRETDLAS